MSIAALLRLTLLIPSVTLAVNLEIGEEINEVCAGCHGEYAEGGKEGEYPRLAGLPSTYIEHELRLFKNRERLNHPMIPYTKERELPEEDLLDVSAYLQTIELYTKLPPIDKENFNAYERLLLSKKLLNIPRIEGDYRVGQRLYRKECASCHGRDGTGKEKKGVPMLAGQYSNYLLKQLRAYQNGERIHDQEAANLSLFREYSDEEIHNLIAYLSILDD
ncbi:MAG: c-type cytochrome [Gammaproteobacteria bacterium]|jgi:cytochrome c553|nr:c-type cytochrome [Gammaproteobacteria bacterium]